MHLSVGKGHRRLRHQCRDMVRDLIDSLDPVIHIVHLSAPGQLPVDGLPHHLVIIFHYIGLDRHPVHRRLLQNAHISDPDQAHMEGSGNRRRRQRQNVHVLLHLLDLFLMGHAEPLLLVDDQESQALKFHIL